MKKKFIFLIFSAVFEYFFHKLNSKLNETQFKKHVLPIFVIGMTLVLSCVDKRIVTPKLAEARVIEPMDIWSDLLSNRHTLHTRYQFVVDSHVFKFYGDLDYSKLAPVIGEKFVIVYDSLHPGLWEFDEHQCGPFFYPDEHVDTVVGTIYLSKMVANKKIKMFWYFYNVKDSFFNKMVYCSEAALHDNVDNGKQFPVIYDPKNKGRAKMLFEPGNFIRALPKRKN
jgi:hypothetical protein